MAAACFVYVFQGLKGTLLLSSNMKLSTGFLNRLVIRGIPFSISLDSRLDGRLVDLLGLQIKFYKNNKKQKEAKKQRREREARAPLFNCPHCLQHSTHIAFGSQRTQNLSGFTLPRYDSFNRNKLQNIGGPVYHNCSFIHHLVGCPFPNCSLLLASEN